LPYVAELPFIGFLSMAQDNDARRYGEHWTEARQTEQRREDQSDNHQVLTTQLAHQNSTPGIETFVIKRPNLIELSHGLRRRDQNIRLIVPRPAL
jgi:hypothetical protein